MSATINDSIDQSIIVFAQVGIESGCLAPKAHFLSLDHHISAKLLVSYWSLVISEKLSIIENFDMGLLV